MVPKATRYQNAVRLLAIIVAAADYTNGPKWGNDVVGVLHAQARLQALDFWVRNPDYFANEILKEFENTYDNRLLVLAQEIIDSREPDLRRLPMVRFKFGAFEPLDDSLALLRSHDFIRIHRERLPGNKIKEHIYLLTASGKKAMDELVGMGPELEWYVKRAQLVVQIAGDSGGRALKDRQYLQKEYLTTGWGHQIPTIAERVQRRLIEFRGNER